MPHRPAGGVAGRPALARTRVGCVAVGPQRAAVDPGVGKRVEQVVARAAEQARRHGGGGDAHEQHVVQPDAVEAVFQREDALDFVRLDHGHEHVAHRQRFAPAREVVRHGEDRTEVVGRVAPLGGEPGVVEVEPAHRRADVEGGLDRVQFKGSSRDPRADPGQGRAGHDRARAASCKPDNSARATRSRACP